MKHKNIIKGLVGGLLLAMLTPLNTLMLTSCSDEPDSEYFYTFTGEMISDWLKSPERPQYSEFAEIVERAGLMDLLATYGQYTCFVPNNDAVDEFLKGRGLSSVSQLSDADCDTIARNHLISKMYTTFDMTSDRLPTQNLMNRSLATTPGFDNDSNAVILIEGLARIIFNLKDDSVENGIMQPVDMVIEKSNSYITDLMRNNPRISTFYNALQATGVIKDVQEVEDPDWDPKKYEKYPYKSNNEQEYAVVPKTKKRGYTFFIEPDDVLEEKYGIKKGDLRALYDLACTIYDPVYPQDVNAPGHSYENLTDSVNPLHRFIQYHILNKYTAGTADLTPVDITYNGAQTAIGIDETVHNPTDWHYTLLPHTMIKIERPTVAKYVGPSIRRSNYINRRYDDMFSIEGQHIEEVETEYVHDAINGHYFYVDDVIGFSEEVQKTVQNIRIRMDFNAIFPEIIGNGLRSSGSPTSTSNEFDESGHNKYGDYYYFPMGYLDGVTFNEGCYFILRRPKIWFNIYQWDEMNLKGDYDITFKLPPVPFNGEWQIRLGFTVYHDGDDDRGVAQVYVDNIPQGIPLDMRENLQSEMYLGDSFSGSNYNSWTDEQKAEQQKTLKNLGAYIYPIGLWRDVGSKGYCHTEYQNMRRVLCQTFFDANKDHYLRLRKTNDGNPNDTFMLDFLELVPKSVYGVDGEKMEDDL